MPQTYDVKQDRKELYAPRAGVLELVDVPPMRFLMCDGHGDPNTATSYRQAVEALYAASYAVRAVAKADLGRVHRVGPLEALWSADDLEVFRTRDKGAWDWTVMIVQPDWIAEELVANALALARSKGKGTPALEDLRFETLSEGRSAQVLHIGSYDDEGPTLERLHHEFLPSHGLAPRGRHHEIYLSDPRKSEPAQLRTILRQPVSSASATAPPTPQTSHT